MAKRTGYADYEYDNYHMDFSYIGKKLTPEEEVYKQKCLEESRRILAELKASGFNQPNKENRN